MKTMIKQIYSKLIGHSNIELSDKFNITKKKSSLISIFLSMIRNIAICKVKLRLVNAIKYTIRVAYAN